MKIKRTKDGKIKSVSHSLIAEEYVIYILIVWPAALGLEARSSKVPKLILRSSAICWRNTTNNIVGTLGFIHYCYLCHPSILIYTFV